MKLKLVVIVIVALVFLSGCLFDGDSDTIIADYETAWIDTPEKRKIYKGEQIVPAYVSEIGHNSTL